MSGRGLSLASSLLFALVPILGSCGCDGAERSPQASGVEPAAAGEAQDAPKQSGGDPAPLARRGVEIYFPSAQEAGLVGDMREIFETPVPGDRAKQIVNELISGPLNEAALRAVPLGTQLRQIYVLEDGTAYIDLSEDLREGIGGGSAEELLTVYSIVNSVVLNVSEIRRVGILINGKPIDTLNGHMDLRRPLLPDTSLIIARVVENGGSTPFLPALALALERFLRTSAGFDHCPRT